jgi:hypothetical protein
MLDGVQRADDAVLVKTVAPIRAAEKRPVAVDFGLSTLRCDRFSGVHRVFVLNLPYDFPWVDPTVVIQGNQVLAIGPQTLEDVHVVGDGNMTR